MDHGNYLSPRLVALSKDSALSIFLDFWDESITYNFIRDALNNNIDISNKIQIKNSFSYLSNKELSMMLEESYNVLIELTKDTLKFVGRKNDAYIENLEWK